jgi:hypothetical protein
MNLLSQSGDFRWWLIEQREPTVHAGEIQSTPDRAAAEAAPSNGHSVSDNLLADRFAHPGALRRHD